MKQKNLVKQMYQACLDNDTEAIIELRKKEFEKVVKHRDKKKAFNGKWTVIR